MMENQFDNSDIAVTISQINERIANACASAGRTPESVKLMAVTKTVEAARVNAAIAAGVCLLGENKAQELLDKYDAYDKQNVSIHFIGHLQSNKVRQIIDKVDMIESLDSLSLAAEIERQCVKSGRKMDCLIEINIGKEPSKSGILAEDLPEFLEKLCIYSNINVKGLMAIPPISVEDKEKEHYFSLMQKLFVDITEKKLDNTHMEFLSMGMSDDFELAIKHGSNLVRLGSVIFGRRNYI